MKSSDVVFVAVKPQYVSLVLREVAPLLEDRHVIVSIAAGITLQTLKNAAGENARLVRVMPNTPCLVGETAAAMCLGGRADDGDAATVQRLFEAVGRIYRWVGLLGGCCCVAVVGQQPYVAAGVRLGQQAVM